jgi:hypothetical protein
VLLRVNFLPAFLVSSAVLRAADAGAKCVHNLARRLAIVKLARGRVVPQLAAAASSARTPQQPPTQSARGLFVWAKQGLFRHVACRREPPCGAWCVSSPRARERESRRGCQVATGRGARRPEKPARVREGDAPAPRRAWMRKAAELKREGRRTGRRVKRLGVSGRRPLGLGGAPVPEKETRNPLALPVVVFRSPA